MRDKDYLKRRAGVFGIAALTLALVLSLMMPMAAIHVEAHAPPGAEEPAEFELQPIWIYDLDGELLEISIEDVADVHGDLCVCLACAFRVAQAAIAELWGPEEGYPAQGEILVTYHSPTKGHKDALEFILTEGACTFELAEGTSVQHLTLDNFAYTFTRTDTGDTFETQIRGGIFPEGYFDLRYEVKGYDKGWHEDEPTDAERAEFASQWTEARDNFLTMEAWELFEGVEEPEEPFPVVGAIFFSILAVAIIGGVSYNLVRRRG